MNNNLEIMTSSKPYLIRAIYNWIVDNNLTPYIAVDTAVHNTVIPKECAQNENIVFDLSTTAANNLVISNNSLEFKARFSGVIRNIYIPIEAVLAIYAQENDRGMAFPSEEFDEEFLEEDYLDACDCEAVVTPQKNKPKFTLLNGGKS